MDDEEFWASVSQVALDAIWNNSEDDIYAQLLDLKSDAPTAGRESLSRCGNSLYRP